MMGSDSTSKFEVKDSKSRKRIKKKGKSKDFMNETSCNTNTSEDNNDQIKEIDKQNMVRKRRKQRKLKSSDSSSLDNNIHKKTIKSTEQENNYADMQQNTDEEDSSEKETPPKRLQRTNVTDVDNSLEDTEACKSDTKKPKRPSKRQLKREKAEKKENEKKEASRLDAMKKGLNYVSKWKHARSEWKFEKLRQIWLIDNLLDEACIPDDIFPTVLEYFEGCKGMAREQLLRKGMDVIRKIEENEENKDKTESVAYTRARKLLQALPTDT